MLYRARRAERESPGGRQNTKSSRWMYCSTNTGYLVIAASVGEVLDALECCFHMKYCLLLDVSKSETLSAGLPLLNAARPCLLSVQYSVRPE
jgi:hypothetical protein